jgi:hypothetical protein
MISLGYGMASLPCIHGAAAVLMLDSSIPSGWPLTGPSADPAPVTVPCPLRGRDPVFGGRLILGTPTLLR